MQDSNDLLRKLHEIYHGPLPEGAPVRTPDNPRGRTFMFRDHQPGSPEFAAVHYPAGEPELELWGPIGPEDFGPIEIRDARTGKHKRGLEP